MKAESIAEANIEEQFHTTIEQPLARTQWWHYIALAIILLVAASCNFYQLNQVGYGNLYYAAAIKSMLMSWHTFLYASFDPGGFVSIDKPPLGFWIQVLSAKLFGFSGMSILLPEAVAGILCVLLLYYLVRRIFGPVTGLLAALALAISPITIVVNRNNTIDSLLILTLLLAAWAISKASETGRLRWLLLGAAIVGLGFNIKMLQAYLIVPALGLMYLLGTPLHWRIRTVHLVLGAVVLLVVSLSWAVAVDLTPASQRPFVGSSQGNSELNLAFGYNGLERLVGLNSGSAPTLSTDTISASGGFTPSSQISQEIANGSAGPGETGHPGLWRLFNSQLGGAIGWLLPMAIVGLIAACWQRRPRLPFDRRQQAVVLWGMWLVTASSFFSVANFFHTYYLATMAPAICALFGIGATTMWHDYLHPGWRGWLLPLALICTAGVQWKILSVFPDWSTKLSPLVVTLCLLSALGLVVMRPLPRLPRYPVVQAVISLLGTLGILALLLAPSTWSIVTINQVANPILPTAGPSPTSSLSTDTPDRSGTEALSNVQKLVQYLQTKQGNTRYLVATLNDNTAAPLILATGKPVMSLGGYQGSDRILNAKQLALLVANNTVHFFLLPGKPKNTLSNLPLSPQQLIAVHSIDGLAGQNVDLLDWVGSHCTTVSPNLWQTASTAVGSSLSPDFGISTASQLYDCADQ